MFDLLTAHFFFFRLGFYRLRFLTHTDSCEGVSERTRRQDSDGIDMERGHPNFLIAQELPKFGRRGGYGFPPVITDSWTRTEGRIVQYKGEERRNIN